MIVSPRHRYHSTKKSDVKMTENCIHQKKDSLENPDDCPDWESESDHSIEEEKFDENELANRQRESNDSIQPKVLPFLE